MEEHRVARRPEELSELFIEFANSGDVPGLVSLYEPGAVLAMPNGEARGHAEIGAFYTDLLADRPQFRPGEPRPALVRGDLALTITRIGADATCERLSLNPVRRERRSRRANSQGGEGPEYRGCIQDLRQRREAPPGRRAAGQRV